MSLVDGAFSPAARIVGRMPDRFTKSRHGLNAWWLSLTVSEQARIKVAALLALILAAFHYSLTSLLQTIDYDTPLAYIGLVPLLAALLAWLHRLPAATEPAIHDRQLDYVVGIPLIALPLLASYLLPRQMGLMYWFDRMDLLLLPLFVAGSVALLFGTRTAWRQRFAIGYLFLAWPWPYSHILLGALNGFTNLTVENLTRLLTVVKVARPVVGSPGLFEVVHNGHSFPVDVVTACSGIDGMVGFLLIGVGFAGIVTGSRLRKIIWLALGAVLLWVTNLGRLLLIFWAGQRFGEDFAINVLHPVAGLIIFCFGVVLMAVLIRPFGLRLSESKTLDAFSFKSAGTPPGTGKVFLAASIVAVTAFVLCFNNTKLASYQLVSTAAGEPKLAPFIAYPASPTGWKPQFQEELFINKPLFGESSRWFRYDYFESGKGGDLQSNLPITADVIDADSLSGFNAYGVEDCYNFHGYQLRDVADVNLGDGVSGQAMSFSGNSVGSWTIVYWIWPVETATGIRYERIILYIQNASDGTVHIDGQAPAVKGVSGALDPGNPEDAQLISNRAFLVAFAREVVAGQTRETQTIETDVDIADIIPNTIPPTAESQTTNFGSSKIAYLFKERQELLEKHHVGSNAGQQK